jgi:hypothetical protein
MSAKNKKTVENTQVIKLVLNENLLKSLIKINDKQNHELMKIVSLEKAIPLNSLDDFLDDQEKYSVKELI